MHLHHDTHRSIARRCKFVLLWHLGERAFPIFGRRRNIPLGTGRLKTPYTDDRNTPLMQLRIGAYTCPSDVPNAPNQTKAVPMSNHNYAANYGNTVYGQHEFQVGEVFGGSVRQYAELFRLSRFRPVSKRRPYVGRVPFKRISDGLSKTLLASEIIQGQGRRLPWANRRLCRWRRGSRRGIRPMPLCPISWRRGCAIPPPYQVSNPPCSVQNATAHEPKWHWIQQPSLHYVAAAATQAA